MPRWLSLILLCAVPIAAGAKAQTILARCGPSSGQSYYFEGGLVGPGQGGWQQDGFKDGRIALYIDTKDRIDIAFRDSTGVRSYLREGNKVELTAYDKENRSTLVSASGSNFVETYLFRVNASGVGTVVWTSSKINSMFTKAGWYSAECGPRFTLE